MPFDPPNHYNVKKIIKAWNKEENKYMKKAPSGWNLEANDDDYIMYESKYGMVIILEKQHDDRWLVSFENTSKDVVDTDAVTAKAAKAANDKKFNRKYEAIHYARRFMRKYPTADEFHKDFPVSSTEYDDRVLDY